MTAFQITVYWLWISQKKITSHFVEFGQVKKTTSHFDSFEQVKKLFEQIKKISRHFADFERVKDWPYSKTPLGETGCLGNPYFLLIGCLSIQFFGSPPTQLVRPPLVTYPSLCSTCVTYGTLYHTMGHQVLPTQTLPMKQRISLGVAIILSMCLCSHTSLDCNQLS